MGDNFTYKNIKTLKNKYGITDYDELEKRVGRDSAKAIINIGYEPYPQQFNSDYLKNIHKKLFGKAFEWAGHTRNEQFQFSDGSIASMPMMKKVGGAVGFEDGKNIESRLDDFDKTLKNLNYFQNTTRKEFVEDASALFGFINHVHPFREGNGRTQRLFFEKIAERAGHKLDFSIVKAERMAHVSIEVSENKNILPMCHMFEDISNPYKIALLKEFKQGMEAADIYASKINLRNVIVAQEGITHSGVFGGGGPSGFMMIVDKSVIVIGDRSHLTEEQLKTLNPGDQLDFKAQEYQHSNTIIQKTQPIKNITSKFLISAEEVQQLSPNDINRMVSDKREVQDQKEVIENLSLLVYGRKNALDNEIENINQNKNHANVLANQIKSDPEQIAPLAGEKKMILGKDQTRKTAELNVPRLSQAIDDYRDIRQRVETTLIREHESERARKSLSVAYPSREVMQVLNMPSEKQKEALQKSPELHTQIQTLSTKISERLSPSENKAILKGDHDSLAKSLNVSSTQAKTIAHSVQQTRSVERQIQAIKVQARQQGIERKR